ncbi:uncharacterized protein LOC129722893 isoform X2 [Wyeomyia smithii]|nr:uncharacterized protein LOC129722893 isoform X2 [Wyeomyia smithii]
MTLLLMTLQQQRIVGPFKAPPTAGNKLEPFAEDFQPSDIQQLINEELQKKPPPPLTQYALSGDSMHTEFAVTQEIPNFGVHFYYVYSLHSIDEFQQTHRSLIPRPLMGPTSSVLRNLNSGVEQFLRTEKKRVKVAVDKTGKKTIQIQDEHFAGFSDGARKTRGMSKRLQKRLGVTLPPPEPIAADTYEEHSPRRPAGDGSVAGAVAAGAASAAATATPGAAKKPKTPTKSGIIRPGATRGKIARKPAQTAPQLAVPEPQVIPVSSPLRFTRHPAAPPTPPLFVYGVPTEGHVYEQEDFDVPATEKFGFSRAKLLKQKWSPSKQPERVQMLDILEQHPITEQIKQIEAEARPRIPTPEIVEEVRETKRRSQLLKSVADPKTRGLMEKFYAVKSAKPRKLDFSEREDTLPAPAAANQSILLLDDTDEFLEQEAMDYYDQFADSQYMWPEITQDISMMPGPSSTRIDIGREEEQVFDLQEEVQEHFQDGALQDEFLSDVGIEFADEPDYDDSPLPVPYQSPARSPMDAARHLEQARAAYHDVARDIHPRTPTPKKPPRRMTPKDASDRLVDISGEAIYVSPTSPRTQKHMMDLLTGETPTKMKLLMEKIADQVVIHKELVTGIKPKSPSMERLLIQFEDSIETLENVRSCLEESVKETTPVRQATPQPTEIDLDRGAEALENLKSRLQQLREARQVKPQTPPGTPLAEASPRTTRPSPTAELPSTASATEEEVRQVEEAIPFSPIGLQLVDVSDLLAKAMDGAQLLQDVAESVPEPIVQEAVNQSIQSAAALSEISDRLKDLTTIWEQTAIALDDSSLGLIEDEELEDIFSHEKTLDSMVESLNQSVKEVIAESGDAGSPAVQQLQTTLRDFQQALQEISVKGSLLEDSLPVEELFDDAIEELERSVQLEKAAIMNVPETMENQEVLEKSRAATEGLGEILDQLVAVAPSSPTRAPRVDPQRQADIEARLKTLRIASRPPVEQDILVDFYEDEPVEMPELEPFKIDFSYEEGEEGILADEEMTMDDLLMEDTDAAAAAFFSRRIRRPPPFSPSLLRRTYTPRGRHSEKRIKIQDQIQSEMANLLSKAQEQQMALLDASLTINDNATDASAVAASQRVTQSILKSQATMSDVISQVQQSPPDTGFDWMGPMASHALPKKPGSRAPIKAGVKQPQAAPSARTKVPSRTSVRPTPGTKPAPVRRSTASSTPAVQRRPATRETLAPPPGVKVPKPRAGSATPVPVKRPPPGTSGVVPTSVRATLPRPTSAASTSRRR